MLILQSFGSRRKLMQKTPAFSSGSENNLISISRQVSGIIIIRR